MEWSFGKDRMASALERLLEPSKKKKWYDCFDCFNCFSESKNTNV